MTGIYVLRSRWSNGDTWTLEGELSNVLRSRWSNVPSRGQPAWCSPVWAFGRTVLLVDSDRCAFTRVDTGTKYLWRRRFAGGVQVLTEHRDVLGTVPGTLGHRFRDASGNVLATRKARFVVSATGEPLASIYGVANQRPNQDNGDDTFVISVLRPIAAPLGLLILTHGLCKRPHIQPQTGGGG
jgi:hypothetical protein